MSESSTSETIDDVTSVFAASNEIILLNSFLNEQQRKVNSVLGDGNCLFRALSKALSGLEDYHPHIREAISEFEETNRNLFEPIHNSIIGTEFDNHVKNIKKLSTWGTTTEIIGAATLFQLDICDRICEKGLPHTSDLQISMIHNFRCVKAMGLQIVQLRAPTWHNNW